MLYIDLQIPENNSSKIKSKIVSGVKNNFIILSQKSKFSFRTVEPLVDYLEELLEYICDYAEVVGSFRRQKSKIGDLEVLVIGCEISDVIDEIRDDEYISLDSKRWEGKTKAAYIVSVEDLGIENLQLEVYKTYKDSLGASRLTRTGPSELNIYMRKLAKRKKMKLNEYGLYNKDGKKLAGKTEKSIFNKLGMDYLTPKQRQKEFG